ncbi:MAG: hypothetical protein ACRD1X_13545 [Vicinamibacteria bacterium]
MNLDALTRYLRRANKVQRCIDLLRAERDRNQSLAMVCADASQLAVDVRELVDEVRRQTDLINTPKLDEFLEAVRVESAHQRERWGEEHDEKKTPEDWYWTLGYLSGKALRSEGEKRLHHVITSAALLFNWFRHLNPSASTSNWVPQEVAQALDCIDRQEDEGGMHRALVKKWRSERGGLT